VKLLMSEEHESERCGRGELSEGAVENRLGDDSINRSRNRKREQQLTALDNLEAIMTALEIEIQAKKYT